MMRFCCVLWLCCSAEVAALSRFCPERPLVVGVFLLGDWAPELGSTAHHLVLQRNSFSASQAQAWQQLITGLKWQSRCCKVVWL